MTQMTQLTGCGGVGECGKYIFSVSYKRGGE